MGDVEQETPSQGKQKKRRGRRVPVSSRTPRPPLRLRLPSLRLSLVEFAVILAVVLFILFAVAVPLRNYFQGATELARLSESIEDLHGHKAELQAEIDKYHSDEYLAEQARQRLGVIEEGETAYRILSPGVQNQEGNEESQGGDVPSWWRVLWDSIAEPPTPVEPAPAAPEAPANPDRSVPLQPVP